jgi:hypothetical protein
MACTISYTDIVDIALDCTVPSGGVKEIKIANWASDYTTIKDADWKVVNFNNQDKTTNYTESLTNNDNGSSVVVQTLSVFFSGFNADTRETLNDICNPNVKLLLKVTLSDGSSVIMGEQYGAHCTQVESSTGAGTSDSQGYTATFTTEEGKHGTVLNFDTQATSVAATASTK